MAVDPANAKALSSGLVTIQRRPPTSHASRGEDDSIRCLMVAPQDALTGGPRTGPLRRYLNPPAGVSYSMRRERLVYPKRAGYYRFSPSGVGLTALRFFLEHAFPLGERGYSLVHSFFWDVRKFEVPWVHESDQSFGQFLSGYNGVGGFVKRKAVEGYSAYLNSRWCGGVVTWSEWARHGFEEDGVDPGKVTVIPPPFDPVNDREPHRGCNVLFIGRDYMRKGGDVALRAFEAASELPDVRFTYVGRMDDPAAWKSVRGDRRVTHIESPSSARLANDVWPVTDILILPTRADAFAVTVIEAMSRGIPVVTSALPAISEVVEDGASGFLVRPGDDEAFGGKLVLLAGDPSLRAAMGAKAKARSASLFGAERVNAKLLGVYRGAIL